MGRGIVALLFVIGLASCQFYTTVQVPPNCPKCPKPDEPEKPVEETLTWAKVIKPIVDIKCLSCHKGATPAGNYNMESYQQVRQAIESDHPDDTTLYYKVAGKLMPPKPKPPLPDDEILLFKTWIEKGAPE